MLCHRDYSESLVARFPHQIKLEYFGGNISVSIEGIELENLSTLTKLVINLSTKACPHHAVFHSFLSDDSKQDAATTTTHIKHFIGLLK